MFGGGGVSNFVWGRGVSNSGGGVLVTLGEGVLVTLFGGGGVSNFGGEMLVTLGEGC